MAALEDANCSLPSLLELSLQAAASGEYWRVQRRQLEALPEEGANALLAALLSQRRVEAPQLALFAHSATVVEVDGAVLPSVPGVGADWLAYLAKFSALHELRLLRCPRLRDSHLSILSPALAPVLRVLSLTGCSGLTAGTAQHLAKLTGLVSLDLTDTHMGPGTARTLAPLIGLTSLQLGGLPTSDDCCIALARMTSLERLVLWGSEVSDQGMRELEHLSRLTALDLSLTRCTSPPLLPTLCQLSMIHCQLDVVGEDREALWLELGGTLPALQELHLSSANFAEPRGQRLLRQLVAGAGGAMRHLCLNLSNVSDLSMLEGATSLTYLNLSGAPTHDALLGSLSLLPLRHLSLSDTGVTDEGVGQLLAMISLTHLDLRNSLVGDGAIPVLAQLSSLQSLDLSGTEFAGNLPPKASSPVLPALTSLTLMDSRLGDRGCKSLAQAAPALRALRLGSSAVTDAGLRALARLHQLTSLMLDGATISDHGPAYLSALTNLRQLHLDNSWLVSEGGMRDLLVTLPELADAQLNGVAVLSQEQARAAATAAAVGPGTPLSTPVVHPKAGRGSRQRAAATPPAAGPATAAGVGGSAQRQVGGRAALSGSRPGRFGKLPEDLLEYDERLKYSREELLAAQQSPLASHLLQELVTALPQELQLQGGVGSWR